MLEIWAKSSVRWTLFLLVSVVVLYAMFRPTPAETLFDHSDKLGHILAFMILGLSGRLALYRLPKAAFWLPMLLAAVVSEYLQGEILPLRSFSVGDIYANLAGVLLALVMLEWFLRDVLRTLQLHRAA